jgi:hypothetical protein
MGQRNLLTLAALIGGVQAPVAFGQILPDNNLYLQDCLECESGLSKEDFMGVIDEVRTVYEGIVENQGGKLEIEARWSDSTVNASAIQMYGSWTVNMYGGLARRPEITKDGFTLVLCHELGHHLGGFPFVSSWGANEGESDYFATHSCAFQLWKDEKEVNAEARQVIPKPAKEQCDAIYSDKDDQNLCYRIVMGGKSLGNLLGALKRQTVSFEKRDTREVRRTEHGHPDAQCRLDTYIAGAVCTVPHDMEVIPGKREGRGYNDRTSEMEAARHSCHNVNGDSAGLRPRCWFKPGV